MDEIRELYANAGILNHEATSQLGLSLANYEIVHIPGMEANQAVQAKMSKENLGIPIFITI